MTIEDASMKSMADISPEKSKYVNVVKALGIISVVIGHSGSPFTSFFYLFHMQLFFFISGYLYKEIYNYEPLLLIKNRFKSLYLPFVKYSLLFLILHNLFVQMKLYEQPHFYLLIDYLKELVNILTLGGTEKLIGVFWFITALIWVNIFYCTLGFTFRYIKCHKEILFTLAIFAIFILGNFLAKYSIELPRVIDIAFVAMIFFHIGYLYKRFEKRIPLNPILSLFCVIFLALSSFQGTISMVGREYVNPLYLLLNSIAGIYFILYLSKLFVNLNFLNFIGKRTLMILAFHVLSFKVISVLQIIIYNYPISKLGDHPVIQMSSNKWWLAYSVAGILLPLCISSLMRCTTSFINKRSIPLHKSC